MKRYHYFSLITILGIVWLSSCTKKDNYAEPKETLYGAVIDSLRGDSIQTEIGSGGTRIKMMEYSWSNNPTPYYFSSMQNGSFTNTKIFSGNYGLSVEGPFVPLVQIDNNGDTIVNKSKYLKIQGSVNIIFKVEPLLRVDWVNNPVLNSDSTITVQVKITRGTTNVSFQQNVTDVFLFVSNTPYCGNNNYDPNYSNLITYSGSTGNTILGTTLTIKTQGGAMAMKRDYYVRVGARIDYGLKQYNYTSPIKISLP